MFGKKKDERNSQIQSEPLKLTTIAMGTVIKGTVDVEGSLRVDGTIEGNVSCHKTMILGPQGTIIGNVTSVSYTHLKLIHISPQELHHEDEETDEECADKE